jgi:hypothetical protein
MAARASRRHQSKDEARPCCRPYSVNGVGPSDWDCGEANQFDYQPIQLSPRQ